MNDDNENRPSIKLVADNGPVPTKQQREIDQAEYELRCRYRDLAVDVLRNIAGSQTSTRSLLGLAHDLIEASALYYKLTGQVVDEPQILALPQGERERERDSDDESTRKWRRRQNDYQEGMDDILQGALRLTAHRLLGERPPFGGKYSEGVIRRGVDLVKPDVIVERVMTRAEEKERREGRTRMDALFERLRNKPVEPRKRKKPWSSRDATSYRDLKPKD